MEKQEERLITRKERRGYLKRTGIMKSKSKLSYKNWCKYITNSIQQGKKRFDENTEMYLKMTEKRLSEKESSIVEHMKERGKTEEEINQFLEQWYDKIFKD